MVDELFFIVLQFTLQTAVLCGVAYLIYFCIKLKRVLNMLLRKITAMDCDEILAALQADDTGLARGTPMASASPEPAHVVSATPEKLQRMRARLAALACGGQARVALGNSFKGRPLTSERVDAMEDTEIEELHARYEARLGAAMSKSLGSSLLLLYANVASKFLPLPPSRQPELVASLEQDPFVSSALQSACCELYYRYGMYLAPLTAALTTAKHCDWEDTAEQRVEDTPVEDMQNANDGLRSTESAYTNGGCSECKLRSNNDASSTCAATERP